MTFDAGSLDGHSFVGSLSVDGADCPAGVCTGTYRPNDLLRTLLTFTITIDGASFAISDDFDYPGFPVVAFEAGTFTFIDFQTSFVAVPSLNIDFSTFENFVVFTNDVDSSAGTVDDVQQVIPEPSSLVMLGPGLAGLCARRWRQRLRT